MADLCAVCGKETGCNSVCSIFGAYSFLICEDCWSAGKEPYRNIVDYISCAGQFPEDINEEYRREVRNQLKLHNKTEEEFIKDVEKAIIDIEFLFEHLNESSDDFDFGGEFF